MRDLAAQITGGNFTASEMNDIITELENIITGSGQSLSAGDLNQIQKAASIYASGGDYYTDSGAADAYVLSTVGSKLAPPAYFVGMIVRFRTSNANTGASTINVSSLGVKNIKKADGTNDPIAGDITTTSDTMLIYNGTSFVLFNLGSVEIDKIHTDEIQVKTTSGDLIFYNQAGTEIARMKDNGSLYSTSFGEKIVTFSTGGSAENNDFNLDYRGILVIRCEYGGNTGYDSRLYFVGSDGTAASLSAGEQSTSGARYTVAFHANVDVDTNTFRITTTGTYDFINVFYWKII